MARVRFAVRMAVARFSKKNHECPYCRSRLSQRFQRKWLLIEARVCTFCGLIFRYPTDLPADAADFYEKAYRGQKAYPLPTDDRLQNWCNVNFANTPFDKSHRLPILHALGKKKILDFGCSWGYSLYQLQAAGFEPYGFEPSRRRAEFGTQKLGVHIDWDLNKLLERCRGSFEIIYSDHVLEHVADLRRTLQSLALLLVPNGRLVLFMPNGGGLNARRLGIKWGPFLGETHTIAFTARWLHRFLPEHGFCVESLGDSINCIELLPDGDELMCVAQRCR